jgi:hypothetical protein
MSDSLMIVSFRSGGWAAKTDAANGLTGHYWSGAATPSRKAAWRRELARFEAEHYCDGKLTQLGGDAAVLDGPLIVLRISETVAMQHSSLDEIKLHVGKGKRDRGWLADCADVGTALCAFAHPTLARD